MKILIFALMAGCFAALGATWQCEIKADRVCLAGNPCRDEKPNRPMVFRM